jgi:hypothetical protein
MNQEKIFKYAFYPLLAVALSHLAYYNIYLKSPNHSGFYMLLLGACYFSIGIKKTGLGKIWDYIFLFFSLFMYLFYFFNSYFGSIGIWIYLLSFLYLFIYIFVKWRTDSKIKKESENRD